MKDPDVRWCTIVIAGALRWVASTKPGRGTVEEMRDSRRSGSRLALSLGN